MNNRNISPLSIIAFIVVICIVLLIAFSCSDSGSHTTSTNICKSCGRSFPAGDDGGNFMNIAKTGMCKNCYNNFQWGKQFIGN